ncbi:hypothetical protein [Burkholderia sp. WSM2230]|uniref:hypothetical protein n=1 Tax=Burkholderia sp. WSM2230 TaxID=944435 RepID=UPI0004121935|nr:hypothetical protein [Burkholderia sp. WSM2230]
MTQEEWGLVSPEVLALRMWMSVWYDHAVVSGFIRAPFELKDADAERLEGYFSLGLTPQEGAVVFFSKSH